MPDWFRGAGFEMPAQCYIIPAGQGALPMKSRAYRPVLLALGLAVCGAGLSHAAELERRIVRHRHVYRHVIVLPPERHVIEIVKEAYSDRFIVNGARFAAKVPACTAGWLAGEPVHFLSGEIHGF